MVFLRYSIRFLVKGQNDTERGRACLRVLPLLPVERREACLDKIILAVLAAIAAICAEVINEKKED